jgi:hypothetical protein
MALPTEVYYRFACTLLDVTGTVESNVDFETGKRSTEATSTVAFAVRADPRRAARIRLPRHQGSGSHDVAVKLLDDGRIASASGSAQGILAEVIGAGVALAGFAASIVRAVVAPGLPAVPAPADIGGAKTPRALWTEKHADDAKWLAAAETGLKELHEALVTTAHAMKTDDPAATQRKLVGLRSGIAALEQEIAAIEARREAWLNADYRSLRTHRFSIAPDEGFEFEGRPPSPPPAEIGADQLKEGSQTAQDLLAALGVAIVDVTPPDEQDGWTTEDANTIDKLRADLEKGEGERGILFRIPRPATLAIYTAASWTDDGKVKRLELDRTERVFVLDRFSRIGSVPFDKDISGAIEFSAGGAASSVTVAGSSELSAVLKALADAPEKLATSMEKGKTVVDTWNALGRAQRDEEVAALEARKKQLEAAVANRGLVADVTSKETLQMVKDRLERAKGDPAPETSAQAKLDEARKAELARLRVELSIEKTEEALTAYRD